MEMFIAIVVVFWFPLIFWWLLTPQYFPFFTYKTFGRWSLFGLNFAFYFLAIIILGLVMPTQEQSANQEPSTSDIIGMFAGFGAIIWIVVRGIKVGRLARAKSPASKSKPTTRIKNIIRYPRRPTPIKPTELKEPEQSKETEQPNQPKKPRKPKEPTPQPPKPALKEDFELGNDNLCEMQYKNSKGDISTRTILIRNLKANKNGDWLVSAIDVEASRFKNFRVDRIVSLSHNNQTWIQYDDILGIVRTFETLM